MYSAELERVLRRNEEISRLFHTISVTGFLKFMDINLGINPNEAEISLRDYAVGFLFATQPTTDPYVMECIRNNPSLREERIFVIGYNRNGRHVQGGNTRAKDKYNKDGDNAQISAISLIHSGLEQYIDNVTNTIGRITISQLREYSN
ncbi:hypothetical protein KY366_02275 [Candidatus Woesearchaeota archaeon]|nr:hypothetical protein [Candidatus Woesearchaeota archaeon]